MFNVTFQRTYKDGDAWENSNSFARQNLLVVSLIAARVFEWIGPSREGNNPHTSLKLRSFHLQDLSVDLKSAGR
jgi:hypothetical protein